MITNSNSHPTSSPVALQEYSWAHTALIGASIASIIGSLFVIYSTLRFKALRKKAFRLIFWLAVSDLGANLATVFLYGNDNLCQAQGILVQYFTTAAILWPLIIALTLYAAVNLQGVDDRSTSLVITFIENPVYVHTFVWVFSGITTLPPVITKDYGRAGGWCWIKDDSNPLSYASIERFVCFYILVWLVFIISSVCYCAVYRALRRIINVNMAGGAQLDIVLRLMNTLKYYPLIFLLSWLPSSIFRLIEDLNPNSLNHPLLISFFTVFKGSCIQGILDAIAFGTTPAVKKSWSDLFSKLKERQSFRPLIHDPEFDASSDTERYGTRGSSLTSEDIAAGGNGVARSKGRGGYRKETMDSSFTKSVDDDSSYSISQDGVDQENPIETGDTLSEALLK